MRLTTKRKRLGSCDLDIVEKLINHKVERKTMCLAVPVQVASIEGNEAEVEIGGVRRRVSIMLTPEAKVGDYVLLHTGYAINVIDEAEARETLKILGEMVRLGDEAE
jgi:hydrogenase expression/formation protein HypC